MYNSSRSSDGIVEADGMVEADDNVEGDGMVEAQHVSYIYMIRYAAARK